jgi:hypothetical protein
MNTIISIDKGEISTIDSSGKVKNFAIDREERIIFAKYQKGDRINPILLTNLLPN